MTTAQVAGEAFASSAGEAKQEIRKREASESEVHSNPQMFVGAQIAEKLRGWGRRLLANP